MNVPAAFRKLQQFKGCQMLKISRKIMSLLVFLPAMTAPAVAGEAGPVPAKPAEARAGQVTCYETSVQENQAAASATNALRKARGLSSLQPNRDLAVAAARHACDMARRGQMTHRGSATSGPMQRLKKEGYRPRIAAENIAAGPWGQEQVLAAWSQSPGHLANILLPQVRHYGIGRAVGPDGKTVYWAAVFSAPR
ncbi:MULTISPECIES: CAP domain-containing protein [Paracoccus]|nr:MULTISPECIES: CAP domain-containing protein [Paracoccus]